MSHGKIMNKCATALKKDAMHSEKMMKHESSKNAKKHAVEKKEAMSASKDLKKRARSAND